MSAKLLVLFNDDSIRDILLNNILWNELDIEIVGIESNGFLGLEQFKYFKPDIVLLESSVTVIDLETYIQEMNAIKLDYYILLFDDSSKTIPNINRLQLYKIFKTNKINFEEINAILTMISKSITKTKLTDEGCPNPFQDTLNTILGYGDPTYEQIQSLNNKISLDYSEKVQIILPRPQKKINFNLNDIIIQTIKKIVNSYIEGEVIKSGNSLCILINKFADSLDFTSDAKLKRLLYELNKYLQDLTSIRFTLFLSDPFNIDDFSSHYNIIKNYYDYAYFLKSHDTLTIKEIQEHLIQKNKIPKENLLSLINSFCENVLEKNLLESIQKLEQIFIVYLKPNMDFILLSDCMQRLEAIYFTSILLYMNNQIENALEDTPFLIKHEIIEEDFFEMYKYFKDLGIKIEKSNRKINKLVIQSMVIINSHIEENISLSYIAQKINTSEAYLSSLFKKETGQNYNDYLTYIRIKRAKNLMHQRNIKINEIAEKVGFYDPRYFSRIFKKYTDLTPTEYRLSICSKMKEI